MIFNSPVQRSRWYAVWGAHARDTYVYWLWPQGMPGDQLRRQGYSGLSGCCCWCVHIEEPMRGYSLQSWGTAVSNAADETAWTGGGRGAWLALWGQCLIVKHLNLNLSTEIQICNPALGARWRRADPRAVILNLGVTTPLGPVLEVYIAIHNSSNRIIL